MRGRRIAAGTGAVRFQPPPPTATAQVKRISWPPSGEKQSKMEILSRVGFRDSCSRTSRHDLCVLCEGNVGPRHVDHGPHGESKVKRMCKKPIQFSKAFHRKNLVVGVVAQFERHVGFDCSNTIVVGCRLLAYRSLLLPRNNWNAVRLNWNRCQRNRRRWLSHDRRMFGNNQRAD